MSPLIDSAADRAFRSLELATLLILTLTLSACSCGDTATTGSSGGTRFPDGGTTSVGAGGSSASSGTTGQTSSGTSGASLVFHPSSATVVVTSASPQTVRYTLDLVAHDGTVTEVSPSSIEFDRPDLATVTAGDPVVVTTPSPLGLYGGTGTLHAIYDGLEATATLTVQVKTVDYGAGVTANSSAVTALNGAGLAPDPAPGISPLLYPYDMTVWPLGLTSPPVMWNAPQAGDVYRMHYAEKDYTFDGYYQLGQLPGSLRLPQDAWDRITTSNQAASGADPLSFELSRWDAPSGAAYAASSQTWTIAPANLRGSIYYWTTSNGGSLSRIPPGAGAVPQPLAGPGGNNCMGCHAVSADGSTLVAGVRGETSSDSSDDRAWTSFDLPSGNVRKVSTLFSGNLAITPDGKFVVSGSETLKLSDSATAATVPNSGLGSLMLDPNMTGIATPAFSPDGTLMAAIEQGGTDWQYWDFSLNPDSELVLLSFDETHTSFGTTPVKLSDSTQFPTGQQTINYPSFSPDSKWVAFQVGDHNSGCWTYPSGCENTTTELGAIYLQSTTPGAAPVRLTQLSDPPLASDANLSLEPTFNPVERGGYYWLVFTSERAWGNSPDVQGVADNDKKRLWVSAIDADIGTVDPSHPAFFLEGQDATTQNMRGFWTLSQCIATPAGGELGGTPDAGACVNGFDCCSGFCQDGACIGVNQVACGGFGDACTSAADCCNPSQVQCVSGVCGIQFQ